MDNDPAKAMLEFQRELETDPSNSNALIQMTRLYLKQGDPEKALPYARRVVKIGPNMAVPHRLLGESLLASGDTPAAIRIGNGSAACSRVPRRTFSWPKRTGRQATRFRQARKWQNSNAWTGKRRASSATRTPRSNPASWRPWLAVQSHELEFCSQEELVCDARY